VTAIRRAAEDGNPLTVADPTWQPMGAPGFGSANDFTPPFPAYVSGHATFGAAVYEVLADYYHTDKMRFTLYSDEMPGVTRSYTRFSQAAEENALSRVYMGVHWDFDATAGQRMGRRVGNIAFDEKLEPIRRGNGNGSDGHGPPHGGHDAPGPSRGFSVASAVGLTDHRASVLSDSPDDDLLA
jgi:hypothetical protein